MSPLRATAPSKPAAKKSAPAKAAAKKAKEPVRSKPQPVATSSIRTVALYRVKGVQEDDVLNVRRGPSEQYVSIAAIPPTGRQVEITGQCQETWCPIRYGGIKGWVNRFYLAEEGSRDEASNTSRVGRP